MEINAENNPQQDKLKSTEDNSKTASSISAIEEDLLDDAGHSAEDVQLHRADLDNTDEEGELLNEFSSTNDRSGGDLDVPGSEADDMQEDIGSEDEENNSYSLKDGDS